MSEQREQDRKRFSDPAFNRWLDEGISDSGHTVWDAIGDTAAAWHGWDNRPHYTTMPDRYELREAARMALDDFEFIRKQLGSLIGVVVDEPMPVETALREALGDGNA